MAPRKKAMAPDGTTSESDEPASQPAAHDVMPAIMANIERTKRKRRTVRKNIEGDFLAAMADLETRIAKRYEAEVSKRSQLIARLLDRLSDAIEQKAACEKAMLNLASSIEDASSVMAVLMNAVNDGRRENAVKARAAPAEPTCQVTKRMG